MFRFACFFVASVVVAPPVFATDQAQIQYQQQVHQRNQLAIERVCTECLNAAPQAVAQVTQYVQQQPIVQQQVIREYVAVPQQQQVIQERVIVNDYYSGGGSQNLILGLGVRGRQRSFLGINGGGGGNGFLSGLILGQNLNQGRGGFFGGGRGGFNNRSQFRDRGPRGGGGGGRGPRGGQRGGGRR